jgi:hypothetical protein
MIMKIDIDGNILELFPLDKSFEKGLWAEARWMFSYYNCTSCGIDFVVASIKDSKELTPLYLERFTDRLEAFFGKPIVFLLPDAPRYQRARYAERGIYYIMPDKGYARLPFLYAGKKMSDRIRAKVITPVAQYILLHHLQEGSLEGKNVSEVCELVPQSYLTVSRAVTTLEDLGLCKNVRDGKNKMIHFIASGRELWDMAQPFLVSPILSVLYLDSYAGVGIIGGINALSHYTHLNPEELQTLVVERKDAPCGLGYEDGKYRIEIWKYPPIGGGRWVDRLSLALSLKDDKDERVQKEIEQMINTIWFTE